MLINELIKTQKKLNLEEFEIKQKNLYYWQNFLFLISNTIKFPYLLNDHHDVHFT